MVSLENVYMLIPIQVLLGSTGMTAVPIMAGYLFNQTGTLDTAFFFQAALAFLGAIATAIYYARRRMLRRAGKEY